MSLEQAVLGFLGYSDFTGYDLKKMFDASIRHFWGADRSQIYRTLTQLEKRGLAESSVIPQQGRPAKKVYRITEQGREAFREWLGMPLPPTEVREASLIQIFFSADLSDDAVITRLSALADELRKRLAAYEQIHTTAETEHYAPTAREGYFWALTLEQGICATQRRLAWLEGTIERIRSGEAPAAEGDNG